MDSHTITDDELARYLDGEELPHVALALDNSAEVQERASAIREFDRSLRASFGGIRRPDPQDLVDVVTGQATDQQKLIVEAYLRKSAQGRREFAELQAAFAEPQHPLQRFAARLKPSFGNLPSAFIYATGLRSGQNAAATGPQRYTSPELDCAIALQFTPPELGEYWQLVGTVTEISEPHRALEGLDVTIFSDNGFEQHATSDPFGFFAFYELEEGTYALEIYRADGIAVISDLVLVEES